VIRFTRDAGAEEGARDDAVDDVDRPEHHHRLAVRIHPEDQSHPDDHEDDPADETEPDGDGDGSEIRTDKRDADGEDGAGDDAVDEVQRHPRHRVLLRVTARELREECRRRRRPAVAHHHGRHEDRCNEPASETGDD